MNEPDYSAQCYEDDIGIPVRNWFRRRAEESDCNYFRMAQHEKDCRLFLIEGWKKNMAHAEMNDELPPPYFHMQTPQKARK